MQTQASHGYLQDYIIQRFIPGISKNPDRCWEATKWGYIHGASATDCVTQLRNMTAKYYRECRNQCREYGVKVPAYRLVAKVPFTDSCILMPS